MNYLVLVLPLIGAVLTAPTPDEKSPIVKRAMETIMFGNQQNSNKQVKKSDPSVPLREGLPDVNAPVLEDVDGSVEATKAEDISEVKPDNEKPENELEIVGKEEAIKEKEEESVADSTENQSSEQKPDSGSAEDSKIAPEDAAAIEELEKTVDNGDSKDGSTALQSSNDDSLSDDSSYDTPYDIYELYKQYQNMLSQDPNYFYGYRRRRRSSKNRRFMGKLKEKAMKRAHRNKRDLTYPDESELYEPYYYPDTPYSASGLYGGYENPYETEASYEPLEELLEDNEGYDLPYALGQYEQPSWYDYSPLRYEDEDVVVPVKRQSMLSFVPGNRKRSPYFYPVNEEPETHFGAFVPEKRDYFDTYRGLVRAARLLAAKEEERDALQGYPEWYR